jgi:membrane protein CcdC involved in cytochrome C biogenesis
MEEAGSKAALIGGLGPKTYAACIVLLLLVAIAITGLLARALATGAFAGALFLVGFAALFGWQIGGFVRRNTPRPYTFEHLPKALLP